VLLQPWRTFSSASSFLSSFLVGYSSITGAILGVMICDYFVIRRGELDVPQLYSINPEGKRGGRDRRERGQRACGERGVSLY
jgi:cytosine/uracil/thiamine/allantoin permease